MWIWQRRHIHVRSLTAETPQSRRRPGLQHCCSPLWFNNHGRLGENSQWTKGERWHHRRQQQGRKLAGDSLSPGFFFGLTGNHWCQVKALQQGFIVFFVWFNFSRALWWLIDWHRFLKAQRFWPSHLVLIHSEWSSTIFSSEVRNWNSPQADDDGVYDVYDVLFVQHLPYTVYSEYVASSKAVANDRSLTISCFSKMSGFFKHSYTDQINKHTAFLWSQHTVDIKRHELKCKS